MSAPDSSMRHGDSSVDAPADRVELLRLVSQHRAHTVQSAKPILRPSPPRSSIRAASYAQEQLSFIEQLEGSNPAYHISMDLLLQGLLDHGKLAQALQQVAQRHEVLRTVFVQTGEGVAQVIRDEPCVPLQIVDLQQYSGTEQESLIYNYRVEESGAGFDLRSGPLFRGRLLLLGGDKHLLLLTLHHIISDGWSLQILLQELVVSYQALVEDTPNPLGPLTVQYADYASWQREWLQGEVLEQQLSYWVSHLKGAPPLLELPTDRPRPPVQSHQGDTLKFSLGSQLSERLKSFARSRGVTPFMVLYAGWAVLLSRLSGQEDVVIATAIANRQRPEVQDLVGLFVNTLILRFAVDPDAMVTTFLQHVKQTILRGYANADVPLERVVEKLQPERSRSQNPLFQVMIAMQDAPLQAPAYTGLRVSVEESVSEASMFDLLLLLEDRGNEFIARANYATALFDESTMLRWTGSFVILLDGMLSDSGRALGDLPLLSDAERRRLVYRELRAVGTESKPALIHELFEEQAARTPHRVAVSFNEQEVTYSELNTSANCLARYLVDRGAGPDRLICICAERSVEMIIGLLGILKAGSAYVPLDPSYPTDRLAYVLQNSAPFVLLIQEIVRPRLPDTCVPKVSIDGDWNVITHCSQDNLLAETPRLSPNNLAYVIYTSGSTGNPKGVMVEHRNVTRLFSATHSVFDFDHTDVWTLFHSFAFDFSVWEIWGALLYGGRLVIVPHIVARSPREFFDLLCREKVTVLNQTPSAFGQLIQATAESRSASQQHALRVVVFGGEALELHSLRPWVAREGAQRPQLVNMYGITETTVHVTHITLSEELIRAARGSVIGQPMRDLYVYLLDSRGHPVPTGVVGEMYVGGDGVARGYLNRPELTSERFVADPFSPSGPARLYRSGDLARRRADGTLEYVGRNDFQVKIRGFRIELGEIEAALVKLPQIKDAVILVREDVPGEKRLVAYVVPARVPAGTLTVEALRSSLKTSLPEHLVPSAYVELDELPLTSNGKLDRRALPPPETQAFGTRDHDPPCGAVEHAIADVWCRLLRIDHVGRHDNFFEVGGHSLLATRVLTKLREQFQVEISLRTFFDAPTIAQIAKTIASTPQAMTRPPLTAQPRSRFMPVSFAQERLFFIDQTELTAGTYNVPLALRVRGRLNSAALSRTFTALIGRHESLRTRFSLNSGEPSQIVDPPFSFELSETDLSGLTSPVKREQELQLWISREKSTAFDLRKTSLLRCRLVRLEQDHHALLMTLHHIIVDGWSLGVLVRDLSTLYAALSQGAPNPLPNLPIHYADYSIWQRSWLTGDILERELSYWRQQLSGLEPLRLPLDRPRPMVASYAGEAVNFHISAQIKLALEKLAIAERATLFMVLLAAFHSLLARYSGQSDIVVGSAIAGRTQGETENLIGFFVNTLALRMDLSAGQSFRQLVRQAREVTLGAYAHQEIPFEKLVQELRPERSLSEQPIFQVLVALQNYPRERLELAGLTWTRIPVELSTAKFDLALHFYEVSEIPEADGVTEVAEVVSGTIEFATDLFDRSTIERLITHLQRLLESAVQDPDAPFT